MLLRRGDGECRRDLLRVPKDKNTPSQIDGSGADLMPTEIPGFEQIQVALCVRSQRGAFVETRRQHTALLKSVLCHVNQSGLSDH